MQIRWIIWKNRFADKIQNKHGIDIHEVEEVLQTCTLFRKAEKGKIAGEDLFVAYGRTFTGRFIIVFFIFKKPECALPISARAMTDAESRYYEKKK